MKMDSPRLMKGLDQTTRKFVWKTFEKIRCAVSKWIDCIQVVSRLLDVGPAGGVEHPNPGIRDSPASDIEAQD